MNSEIGCATVCEPVIRHGQTRFVRQLSVPSRRRQELAHGQASGGVSPHPDYAPREQQGSIGAKSRMGCPVTNERPLTRG